MSRMAFLTRVLVFSQLAAAEPVDLRPRGLARRVLLDAVEGLDRDLELVAALVAEHHELARGAADLERLEPHEAADAVLLVDDEVADLEVAEVGEEAAQPAAAPARVEVHLLREDVAVGEHEQPGLGQLEAARERAHARQDARTLADREAVLAQDVREAVGAAGVAEEHDRGGARRAQVGGQPAHVARVARRRAARPGAAFPRPSRPRAPRARAAPPGAPRAPRARAALRRPRAAGPRRGARGLRARAR